MKDPRRILLVRLGAVGDVVRTLPLLHALRAARPDARIGWLVEEPSSGLLREVAALDAVHVLPRRELGPALARPWQWPRAARTLGALRDELRAAAYDLVLDAHGTLKAALVSTLPGATLAGLGRGGSKEGAHLLYDRAHAFPARPMSRMRRALFLGAAEDLLGDEGPLGEDGPLEFGLRFPPARTRGIDAFAAADARALVVLVPFASARGQSKRWPLARFVGLGGSLHRAGARAVLAWGSAREGREAAGALAAAPGSGVELAPPTDLVELSALLARARLVVTGDTGPMHLAAAGGARVLALFGPSDPVVNRPWGAGHDVIVHRPLDELPEDRVLAAALNMIN
jgi:lipopolysaccharide heptosyltransferase I